MSKKKGQYVSNEEGARVYQNPILHYLSQTHIAVPLTIFYGAGVAISIYAAQAFDLTILPILAYFFIGFLSFTFAEYCIHRFIYHLPTVYEEGGAAYALHGIHHKYPRDKKRLVMPPVLSVLIASIILSLNYFLMGEAGFPFTAGFLFGYAAYLSVHFIVHRFKPPKNFFKALWIHHSIHHYQDDEVAFGVSSPLWDFVFGTMPKKNKKAN
ncbi:MAG: sterol desaturase family protein [Vicingaceae bacterium]